MNTVEKTLAILDTFLSREKEQAMGITRLVDLTGLNISTIHRTTSSLVKKGYLTQPHPRAPYSLGPKFLQFVGVVMNRMKIRDVALPFMVKLNREVNECVNLVVLDSDEAVYIECVEPEEPGFHLRIFTQLGARVPLYCAGAGKVLLAHMTGKEQEKYLSKISLTRRTPNTITDCEQLKKVLAAVVREGYAIDDEEMELGVRCIAVPIRNNSGNVVAALSVSGPYTRLTNTKMRELEPLVKSCASDISKAVGYVKLDEAGNKMPRAESRQLSGVGEKRKV